MFSAPGPSCANGVDETFMDKAKKSTRERIFGAMAKGMRGLVLRLDLHALYYRYPLLRLDLTFGSRRNSAPISLDFCKHTLVVSVYMFRVFFRAENDAEER